MRNLLTIFFFLPLFALAGHWTPCSGSGACSITSMSGHSIGDTANMTGGTYSSITINNMQGIDFIATSQVNSPSMSMSLDSACTFDGTQAGTTYGYLFTGSITVTGHIVGLRFYNPEFSGAGVAISVSSNVSVYDQTNAWTKTMRNCSFQNPYFTGCGEIMQGTFGGITALQNVIDSVSFLNMTVGNDQSNGTLIQGNGIYRLLIDGGKRTGNTLTGTTDIGIVEIGGNAVIRRFHRSGGYGYLMRIYCACLDGVSVSSYIYDCIDEGHHRYGTFDARSGNDFSGGAYIGTNGLVGADFYCLNNTTGNNIDTAAVPYVGLLAVIGSFNGFTCHVHNNFSYNTTKYSSPGNIVQWNAGSDTPDTTNNFYQPTASYSLQDSTTTWMPLSGNTQLRGTGTNESAVFTTDYNKVTWSPWGIGAVMYVAPPPPADTLYVATSGNDANTGTYASPFATILGAQTYFHAHTALNPVIVMVQAGTYQTTGMVITENTADSNRSILDSAYGGPVYITGGVTLQDTAFHLISDTSMSNRLSPAARSHVFVINLTAQGVTDFGRLQVTDNNQQPNRTSSMEVFYNKQPYHLACWPNSTGRYWDDDSVLKIGPVGRGLPGTGHDANFSYAGMYPAGFANRPAGWKKATGTFGANSWASWWLRGTLAYNYTSDNGPIDSINTTLDSIYLGFRPQNSIYASSTTGVSLVNGSLLGHYFYNVFEELDTAGEWYLDSANANLYIYADSSIYSSLIQVSTTGGTYPTNTPLLGINTAANMRFSGINFECTRGQAINLAKSHNITFNNCNIRNFGGIGVVCQHTSSAGCQNINFNGGSVSGGGQGCIDLDGAGTVGTFRTTLTPGSSTIRNMNMYNWSRNYRAGSIGIQLTGVGDTIENCALHDDPDLAINFIGNNHYIANNKIKRVCWHYGDQGAIYTGRDPSSTGTIIHNNLFDSICNPGHAGASISAVYIDDQSGGITVSQNLFQNCGGGHGAVHVNGGGYSTFLNNIFLNCALSFSGDSVTNAAWNATWIHGADTTIVKPYVNLAIYKSTYPWLNNFFTDTTKATNPLNNYITNTNFSQSTQPYISTGNNWIVSDSSSAGITFINAGIGNYNIAGTPSQTTGWTGWEPFTMYFPSVSFPAGCGNCLIFPHRVYLKNGP